MRYKCVIVSKASGIFNMSISKTPVTKYLISLGVTKVLQLDLKRKHFYITLLKQE